MDFNVWGQVAGICIGGLGALVYAVSHLFRSMGHSYGGIISALSTQNIGQQKQIDGLERLVAEGEKKCDERIKALEKSSSEAKSAIRELSEKVDGK